MAKQINSSPTKESISNLVGKIKREELIIQPEFQRKFVWTNKYMEAFIKTILDGYPFPEIYISQKGIDIETLTTQNVVVDGQQRLTTILKYIDGDAMFEKSIPKFKQLSDEEVKDFLNYDITIRDLKDVDKETIIEIFSRINSTKFTLNSIEINNALYDGEFISTAKNILDDLNVNNFRFEILSDIEISRMADLQFILLIMSTIEEGGYFNANKEVEKYISIFNDDYPSSALTKTKIVSKLLEISDSKLADDSIWFRKSNFFTLLIESIVNEINISDNLKKLIEFGESVIANKTGNTLENEYAKYYSYMYTGTNSRQARVVRSEIFRKYILK